MLEPLGIEVMYAAIGGEKLARRQEQERRPNVLLGSKALWQASTCRPGVSCVFIDKRRSSQKNSPLVEER